MLHFHFIFYKKSLLNAIITATNNSSCYLVFTVKRKKPVLVNNRKHCLIRHVVEQFTLSGTFLVVQNTAIIIYSSLSFHYAFALLIGNYELCLGVGRLHFLNSSIWGNFNLTIVENKNHNEQLYKQSISMLCSRLN